MISPEKFAQETDISVDVLYSIEEGRFPLTHRLREKFANYLGLDTSCFHINSNLASDAVNRIADPLDRMVAKILLDIYEFHSEVKSYSHLLLLSLRDEEEREKKNGSANEETLTEIRNRHQDALEMCRLVLKHVRPQEENSSGVFLVDMMKCYEQIRAGDMLLDELD